MANSKLTSSQFMMRHYGKDTEMVEFKSSSYTCRSLIENDGSVRLIYNISLTNKTTYLRRMLNMMKKEALIDESVLKKYNLYDLGNKFDELPF